MARAKRKTAFVCEQCGAEAHKWSGRCLSCGAWNTLSEFRLSAQTTASSSSLSSGDPPKPLTEVSIQTEARLPVQLTEFDRVLGGGILPGAFMLLGGEPGVGKSTLLMQVAYAFAKQYGVVLYVSGEESLAQIRLRAERLGTVSEHVMLLADTDVAVIQQHIDKVKPKLIIVDSVQTMMNPEVEGVPGSLAQVRETALHFQRIAKQRSIPIFLVGHVTKQGGLAGPKVLEHIVDVVLQFDGEKHTQYRLLRTLKNRFGATSELGMFEMETKGLTPLADPSGALLAERPIGSPGSVVVCSQEGSRVLLVEIQSLVADAPYGGTPRRQVAGLDYSRVSIVLAVLERRSGIHIHTHEVYLNVAGGLKIEEPAADLGIALAVASAFRNQPVPQRLASFGEIGLAGEVRGVAQASARIQEAARLGFDHCIVPRGNMQGLQPPEGIKISSVSTVSEALDIALQ